MQEIKRVEEFATLDDELKQEFYADVKDCVQDINECEEAVFSTDSEQLINRLFRSIHTVKGNCNMVFLAPYVDAVHQIEEMVQDVRNQRIAYHPSFALLFIKAINLVHKLLIETMASADVNLSQLSGLTQLIVEVRQADESQRNAFALRAGCAIDDEHLNLNLVGLNLFEEKAFTLDHATDVEFFYFLSECRSATDPILLFRVSVMLKLLIQINNSGWLAAPVEQLKAAVLVMEYFRPIENEPTRADNLRQIHQASALMKRIPGWTCAANLIAQVHEHLDGSGLPLGLVSEQIDPDAKILHLLSQFATAICAHREQGYKQSLFAATKAVNQQLNRHYTENQVAGLNQLIRDHYLKQVDW